MPVICSDFTAVYADMHDGDQKEVAVSGTSMTITPSGNSESWVVNAVFDPTWCNASVDFNVPGKPAPPPVNLTATVLLSYTLGSDGTQVEKKVLEFTDPSGTLAYPSFPLNHWVPVIAEAPAQVSRPCAKFVWGVYADMHDGDKKQVEINGDGVLTITPYGNDQTWKVVSQIDSVHCTANVDFNVPGKPSPPPVNLTATLWKAEYLDSTSSIGVWFKTQFQFTDPSGTLAAASFPLNEWVLVEDLREVSV